MQGLPSMFQYVKVQTKAQNYLGRFVCCNDVLDVLCASFKIFVVGSQYPMDEGIFPTRYSKKDRYIFKSN